MTPPPQALGLDYLIILSYYILPGPVRHGVCLDGRHETGQHTLVVLRSHHG